jgi:hypothetical protein
LDTIDATTAVAVNQTKAVFYQQPLAAPEAYSSLD